MENEPRISHLETPENRFGSNVEMHVFFMRHGAKDLTGTLTEEGKQQATKFGEDLEKRDAIKGYSSPVKRALETVEKVIEGAPHDKKLNTRIRAEIGMPPLSEEFMKKFNELAKNDPDTATDWYLNFGKERPDPDTLSPHEVAESLAYVLNRYSRMAKRLYSGSNIDLVNVTHQGLPEALLKEILIRKDKDREITGFEKLEEIGGALNFAEGMEFSLNIDEKGEKKLSVNFRGQEYSVDMDKLEELAESYEK
ncbi:MAG: histidine phosphatase family protein [Patescibacteria group bacterium]